MPQAPHFLITGAGVSVLSLAQGLQKHGIKVTVFERDTSNALRAHGYRFRMNHDGSEALKSLLSEALFTQFERTAAKTRLRGGAKAISDGTIDMGKLESWRSW